MQATPDFMPGDVTGFWIFDQHARQFEFLLGPVIADVLLAEEINRAIPRTQSALLEAMGERQVMADSIRTVLSPSFFAIATQNLVDQHGTYSLPEAELDRFVMQIRIGSLNAEREGEMLAAATTFDISGEPDHPVEPLGLTRLRTLQERVARIAVARPVSTSSRSARRRERAATSISGCRRAAS